MYKKKTIILKESELIELIESTVNDMQEQYDQYMMTPDGAEEVADMYERQQEWMKECDACRKEALRLARKIVALEFESWTEADSKFYYENEKGLCCEWVGISDGMPGMIAHVEAGEPGWCEEWHHCVLPVIEIGLLFIPGIGWGVALGLSMSVGLLDAAIYYAEGDTQTAGLVAFLTILPGVPGVVKKFPFVKAWAKGGAKKIAGKMITGEGLSVLERYQLKALSTESAQEFLELEVKQHIKELASKEFFGEATEIAGKKITNEMIDNAVEKGYIQFTIDGVTAKLSKEMVESLGTYTAKQQSKLIKFGTAATPFILAGIAYTKIYNELAKTGLFGPKDLIEKKWGIDLDDKSELKISKFFLKMSGFDVSDMPSTKWEVIKALFHSDGSGVDGEKMVQAIKAGWNPLKLPEQGDLTVVPKKYRTTGYKEFVNNVLNDKAITTAFMLDGSEEDNDLLLLFIIENKDWEGLSLVPEQYRTETYKKQLETDKTKEAEDSDFWDNLELE